MCLNSDDATAAIWDSASRDRWLETEHVRSRRLDCRFTNKRWLQHATRWLSPIGGDFAKTVWPEKRVQEANRRIMDHCQNIAFGYGSDTYRSNKLRTIIPLFCGEYRHWSRPIVQSFSSFNPQVVQRSRRGVSAWMFDFSMTAAPAVICCSIYQTDRLISEGIRSWLSS
jgi:hypothetical protein